MLISDIAYHSTCRQKAHQSERAENTPEPTLLHQHEHEEGDRNSELDRRKPEIKGIMRHIGKYSSGGLGFSFAPPFDGSREFHPFFVKFKPSPLIELIDRHA